MQKTQGFTLIEVLVTLGLLATLLTASYTLSLTATKQVNLIRQHQVIAYVKNNLIANLKLGLLKLTPPTMIQGNTAFFKENIHWQINANLTENTKQIKYTLQLTSKDLPPYQTQLYTHANQ